MGKHMNLKRTIVFSVCFCLITGICTAGLEGSISNAAANTDSAITGDFAENQIIVVFEDDVNKKEAAQVVEQQDGKDMTVLETPKEEITASVELPKDQTVEEAVEVYQKEPEVAYAQPNYKYQLIDDSNAKPAEKSSATTELNDTYRASLWHLNTIQAQEAWKLIQKVSHSKTKVAVLDTGVNLSHTDLQQNLNKRLCKDTSSGKVRAMTGSGDDDGHGTHVAGILAATANNGKGTAGVASGIDNSSVELFAVDVFRYSSNPSEVGNEPGNYAFTDGIISGINYASSQGAKVINMSLGYAAGGKMSQEDRLMKQAVDTAVAKGSTIVCAAGNEGNTVTNYPADFNNCISVISTNKSNRRSDFSNYGSAKDISAPGGQESPEQLITSASKSGGYIGMAGTSMASPVVAGVAALLYSLDPTLTVSQTKNILYSSATDIYASGRDKDSGYGIVNAYRAVAMLQGYAVKVTLNKSSVTLSRGAGISMKASIIPSSAANKKVAWKSSNTKVARVDSQGYVTAVALGKATITATSADRLQAKATCQVTVPYKITYNLNGGKNDKANPSTYYGKKITLKSPSRTGYAFSGWYKDSKYKSRVTSFSSGDYVLYAKWKKVTVSRASIKKLSKTSRTKIKIYQKKISSANGYQIAYSTSKKFTNKTTRYITTKSTAKTLTKLKNGTRYYIKVRAYKLDSAGKKVYGKYSKVKSK